MGDVTRRGLRANTRVGSDLEALMHAYIQGDERAFEALFAALAPRLHGFFLRSFGSAAVADDLLQTVFLKIHAGRATYATGRPLKPWVYAIATRVRADELRRRYRIPLEVGDEVLDDQVLETSALDPAEARQRAERVRAAVDALPEGQRVVVLLHRFEGLSFEEIGQALGLEAVTVRVRAFRAYARLRDRLRELMLTEEPA